MDLLSERCYYFAMSLPRSFFVLWLVLGGCLALPTDGDPAFRERLLATIPEDARVVVPVAFSVDGRKAAWVQQRGGTSRAVCGEWQGKPYGVVC